MAAGGGPDTVKVAKQAIKQQPEYVVAQEGSRAFRAFNFELYAKPTGNMRILAYAGSAAFLGVIAYFTFQDQPVAPTTASSKQQRYQ